MSNKDKIALYSFITDKYEVASDEIEKEFGIIVGKQFNSITSAALGGEGGGVPGQLGSHDRGIMSDEEYYKRYGHRRGEKKKDAEDSVNFLTEEE
jgi:hypothetical protein